MLCSLAFADVSHRVHSSNPELNFDPRQGNASILNNQVLAHPHGPTRDSTPTNLSGWHTNGQTFLVWEHSPAGPPLIYEIYLSSNPITSINGATLIGAVYSNNGENSRLQSYIPDARWLLPDGFGNTDTVGINEAYFVVTPHEPGVIYYAVVPYGDSVVGEENTAGPIIETTDPITCYIQHEELGLTIYAHWIDGRHDYTSGRPDYPGMGNEYSNGLGFNFAVWNSTSLTDVPMVVWLHGIGGSFIDPDMVDQGPSMVPNGLFVTFDDRLDDQYPSYTSWIGYANDFNRFSPQPFPDDAAIVVNYTARRVWWETDWLIGNFSVDPQRVSLVGESMGGNAVLLHTELRPDMYASAIANVPALNIQGMSQFFPIFGTPVQNLLTTFNGQPALWDIINAQWRAQQPHEDWPYALVVSGKNDQLVGWQGSRDAFVIFDSTRTGYALYWDERTHTDWTPGHFHDSEHLAPSFLTRFYKNKSFPAFSATDESRAPGRQPDIGNGDPLSGDTWGTWAGYFEWDTESIVDQSGRWECTIWIPSGPEYPPCDVPLCDSILADVTLKKLENLNPVPGKSYDWELVDIASGNAIQSGTVEANENGMITIEKLLFAKAPYRLKIVDPLDVQFNNGEPIPTMTQVWNSPNPAIGQVQIICEFPFETIATLRIYDVSGRTIKILFEDKKLLGRNQFLWDGKDEKGRDVGSGHYFYCLQGEGMCLVKKAILLR